MKSGTTIKYPYTGELYGYTQRIINDTPVTEYTTIPTPVEMVLSVNLLGELIIQSQTKMQINAYLKNIVDINGEEIYTDGVWEITQTAPILGPGGVKGGYKYRAKLIEGQI